MRISILEAIAGELPSNVGSKKFDRNTMPQLKLPDLQKHHIPFKRAKIDIDRIKPVQTQRVPGLAQKVARDFHGKDKPFILDQNGYLVNGHHRYDAARMLGIDTVDAIFVEVDIEDLINMFPQAVDDTPIVDEDNSLAEFQQKLKIALEKRRLFANAGGGGGGGAGGGGAAGGGAGSGAGAGTGGGAGPGDGSGGGAHGNADGGGGEAGSGSVSSSPARGMYIGSMPAYSKTKKKKKKKKKKSSFKFGKGVYETVEASQDINALIKAINEAPINRSSDTYDPNPNDAYKAATTDTTPKYQYDPERDYRPGKSLGPIPNIQSQTEVIVMPDGIIYLFYVHEDVKQVPEKTFWQKFVTAMLHNPKANQTGPTKEKNVIGFLKLKPFEDGYRVAGVGMDPSIQKQGRAIKLYIAFSAWKKVPIYSDYTQTPGAIHMWQSIINRYPNKVVAYDQKTKQDIPLDKAGNMYQDEPVDFTKQTQFKMGQTLGATKLFKLLPESLISSTIEDVIPMNKADPSRGPVLTEIFNQDDFDKVFKNRKPNFSNRNLNPNTRKYVDNHKWKKVLVNIDDLDDNAYDDQFGRIIDVDPEVGVNFKDPIMVHADGKTIIDGFHRVYQAKKGGLKQLPAYIPEGISTTGDCYEANGRAFQDNNSPTARLIHADITPRLGNMAGRTYGHAWIEDGNKLVDHTTVGTNVMALISGFDDLPDNLGVSSKSIFYGIADPKNIKRYDSEALFKMITKHQTWGPWETTSEGTFIQQFEPEYSEKKREIANKLRKKLGLDPKPELDWKIDLANKMQRAEWIEQYKDIEKNISKIKKKIKEQGPTQTPKYLYHVTFKSNIQNIKAKGLEQFHTSLWVKGPEGKRYNQEAGIFAFDHPLDAIQWAQKMEWEFRNDIIPNTNDDIAIIRVDMQDGEEIWGDDPSDDIMLTRHGKSLRSRQNIKADKIIDAFSMAEFGKAGVLKISREQWLSQVQQKLAETAKPPEGWISHDGIGKLIGNELGANAEDYWTSFDLVSDDDLLRYQERETGNIAADTLQQHNLDADIDSVNTFLSKYPKHFHFKVSKLRYDQGLPIWYAEPVNILVNDVNEEYPIYKTLDYMNRPSREERQKSYFKSLVDKRKQRELKDKKDKKKDKTNERPLTKDEEDDKEKYVKGMKKNKKDFKKRYGKNADAVMYATATKMAKENVDNMREGKFKELDIERQEHEEFMQNYPPYPNKRNYSNYKGNEYVFLNPNNWPHQASTNSQQLKNLGFRLSKNGQWYMTVKKYKGVVGVLR